MHLFVLMLLSTSLIRVHIIWYSLCNEREIINRKVKAYYVGKIHTIANLSFISTYLSFTVSYSHQWLIIITWQQSIKLLFNRQNNKTNSTLHIDIGLETVTDRSISWEYKMSTLYVTFYGTMNSNLFCYIKFFERLKVICRHLMPQNNAYTQTRLTATWLYFCGVYKNLRYYCNILFSGHIITDNACFVSENT